MGVFSEIAMEQQNSMFDSSAAFEDDEAFELEEMESLPVPPVGTDTAPVSAASVLTASARFYMHPKKNMIRCFQYINRKAWDYVQDELKASGTRPGPGQQAYGCDVPDDLCYQWAEDYFRDPDAKEDHEDEEKFVPKPYAGKSSAKSKPKKAAEKKKTEPKSAPKQEEKKPSQDGQMSLLDFGMAKAG